MNFMEYDGVLGIEDRPGHFLPIRQILGIGRNYAEHAHEQGAAVPDRPMVFAKAIGSVCLHGQDIVIPPSCRDPETGGDQVDFEAELAVIIGRAAKDVPESSALEHVAGYCCANDVSARWWQRHGSGGQFNRGKSFDTFCPMGPEVVAPSAVGDVQNLRVRCFVNGQMMQDGSTSQMIFPVATLISELSRGCTLVPGTVILTGTPSGVGFARNPPVFLKDGDEVTVEIENVGRLTNGVRNG